MTILPQIWFLLRNSHIMENCLQQWQYNDKIELSCNTCTKVGHFVQHGSATRKSAIFAIRNFNIFCNKNFLLQKMLKFLIAKMVDFRVAQNVRLWCCKKARFCRCIIHCCRQLFLTILIYIKSFRFATDRVKFVLGKNEGESWSFSPQDPFIKWQKCAPLTQNFFWRDKSIQRNGLKLFLWWNIIIPHLEFRATRSQR